MQDGPWFKKIHVQLTGFIKTDIVKAKTQKMDYVVEMQKNEDG